MTPEFWETIDRTRPDRPNPRAHAAAITTALVESGTKDTLRFAAAFDEAIDALYAWDLWGAAYLSFSGCSDDAFEYLRAWLIGAGERVWASARNYPERLFIELLDGADDPDARWEELRIHEGEPLLYIAGTAHERLTGSWLSGRGSPHPDAPAGDMWAEDELPGLYPDLFAVLPDGWWGEPLREDPRALRVMVQVERGVGAFSEGDHAEAGELLDSIVDDPAEWEMVAPDRRIDVAYIVGIGRLLAGDVEGASTALRLVESELEDADHVRRALAQVEMARGDLDNASRWIDQTEEASRYDRVLAAKHAWRRGDHEEAILRANSEMATSLNPDEHPWDVAGSAYQIGQIFADAGDVDNAILAAGVMTRFLEEAPRDLPLLTHLQLLLAAITRLQGEPYETPRRLRPLRRGLSGTDLAECLREEARAEHALGNGEHSAALYQASVNAFQAAGERWEAKATLEESERPSV
jgi:hypothetical protein